MLLILTPSGCKSYILTHFNGAFQDQFHSVLCIIGSDWKDLSLYIRVKSFHLQDTISFQNQASQLETKITQGAIKMTSTDMERRWNTQNLGTYLHSYKKTSTNTTTFMATITTTFTLLLQLLLYFYNYFYNCYFYNYFQDLEIRNT